MSNIHHVDTYYLPMVDITTIAMEFMNDAKII